MHASKKHGKKLFVGARTGPLENRKVLQTNLRHHGQICCRELRLGGLHCFLGLAWPLQLQLVCIVHVVCDRTVVKGISTPSWHQSRFSVLVRASFIQGFKRAFR